MPHLSSLKNLTGHKKTTKQDQTGDNVYNKAGEYVTEAPQSRLHVLKFEDGEQSFWQRAWEQAKEEAGVDLPVEWHLESLDLKEEVKQVAQEALLRSKDTARHERLIHGTKYTYRQLYDNVASWANKFTAVGDLIVQADPGYATLPWSMIRFAIKLSLGESETYHRMLDGTQFVAQLVTQYPVIEKTYARLDSDLATALRKSLYDLYVAVLRFQINAIKYFDPNKKFFRALRGINPVSSDDIRDSREAINGFKDQVDRDIALVHSDVTKRGIDELVEGKEALLSGQKDLLNVTRDGILALSENTGASFRSQQAVIEGKFDEAEARNQKRNDAILDMWRGPLDAMSAELEKERIQREKEELLKIRQWLSTAEPETNYYDARAKRHLALGDWLLQHHKFQKWKHTNDSALLWMYGFAGTGKTGLVCRVIDDLRERLAKGGSERIGFFFCSNDQSDSARKESYSRSDPEEALRSIVSRLSTSQRTRSAATVVQDLYQEFGPHSDKHRTLNSADCVEIVVALAREMPVTIIIDAFDELDQGKSPVLLQHLKNIIDRCPERVKIFISTRSFPAIENELNADEAIEVTTENNGKDVRTFIQRTLQDRIDDGSLLDGKVSDELQTDIENTLATRARNMFLYASLQLSQICDRNSNDDEDSIRKKLNNLPSNLTAVYDGIMEKIHDIKNNSERSCRLAQETFKWLLRTQTMLLCDFLLQAISPPEREATIDEILHACRTLIVKSKVLGKPVFEFAHYSVREHVTKMDEYRPSKCHLVVLKSCLRILNKDFVTDSVVPKKDEDSLEAESIFIDYALQYWPLHYEGIEKQDMNEHRTEVNTALRNFLLKGRSKADKYANWFAQAQQFIKRSQRDHYLISKLNNIEATPPTALFAACVFGIDDLVGKFGRELDGLNKKNLRGQTALSLAIENNKIDVVKALLSRRFPADLNLLNVSAVQQFEDFDAEKRPEIIIYASALQCAAATGRLEIAEFLIKEGAHIDLVAGYYGSPLQAAALNGHSEVVSLLLREGAEPNSQGGFHGNALQAAAAEGHSNIISLLFENKPPALIDTPGGHYGSALMAAICSGNADTVWALLEERAPPNMKSKTYGSPLENATRMGQAFKEIVSLLIDNRAEADLSPRGTGVHILHKAAMYNMVDLAEHCLDRGCQIDMITTEGPYYPRRYGDFAHEMTPLGFGCAEGHVEMVDFLLSRGAPYELDKPQSAPLWTAAYQGHARIVDLLLTRFKATHSKDAVNRFLLKRPHPKSGHPILFAAASSGKPDAVRVLLDHGVKYEANWYNATPLLATATFKCPEVTESLLEYHKQGKVDVQIDKQANNGRTALMEACARNRQWIEKMLLDAGADYTITDNEGATALHFSTDSNNVNLGRLLLEKSASGGDRQRFLNFINTRHKGSGRTALIDSVAKNKPASFQMLLDHGADYNIAGHAGNNPLLIAVQFGHNGMIERLLTKVKSDHKTESQRFYEYINRQNRDNKTAIYGACECNQPSTVKLLLEAGADYTITNANGQTPLNPACWNGHKAVVRTVLDYLSKNASPDDFRNYLNHRNKWGITALFEACTRKDLGIIDMLLAHGSDYTIPRNSGVTVLHAASYSGNLEVVERLLAFVAKEATKEQLLSFVNRTNDNGNEAIWDAVAQNQPRILQLLLKHGAAYTMAKDSGTTVLHRACLTGEIALTKTLLDFASKNSTKQEFHGFLNKRGVDHETALFVAFQSGPQVMELLLDHGADYTISDERGFTVLHHCVLKNRDDILHVLLDKTKSDRTSSSASLKSRFATFLNHPGGQWGETALGIAADHSLTQMASRLLEAGADWDCPDSAGNTPAHQACNIPNKEIYKLLVAAAGLDGIAIGKGEERSETEKRFFDRRTDYGESVLEAALRNGLIKKDEVPNAKA